MDEGTVASRVVLENAATKSFVSHGLRQHPRVRSPTRIILVAICHAPNLLVGITSHCRNVPDNIEGNIRRVQFLVIHGLQQMLHCFECARTVILGDWGKKGADFRREEKCWCSKSFERKRCCIERKKKNCDLRGILNDKEIASQVVREFKNVLSKVYRSLPKMCRSMRQEYR
jgi:hypothetical protein